MVLIILYIFRYKLYGNNVVSKLHEQSQKSITNKNKKLVELNLLN